jgi:predicted membrane protein
MIDLAQPLTLLAMTRVGVAASMTLVVWIGVMAVVMEASDFWIWFWIVISLLSCILIGMAFALWLL